MSTTLEPSTWDTDSSGTGEDAHGQEWTIGPGDAPSAPSWSPDGSRFAFAKLIDDDGDYVGLRHSAIFVHTIANGETTQLTTPRNAELDPLPEEAPAVGHVVSDFAPAWSADGTTVAFVRRVGSLGEDDDLWDQRGQNLWRVPAGGGEPTQVTTFLPESGKTISGGVWIPGTPDLVVSYTSPGLPPSLGRLSSSGGTPAFLTGSMTEVISDFDVSPDGTKLAFNTIGAGGLTTFVQPFSGPGAGVAVSAGTGTGSILRFAGTGDGLLLSGCSDRSPSVCGLMNRLTPDPDADIDHDETEKLALAWDEPVTGAGGVPGRMAFDIQAQKLPIVFVPGFLGTRIACPGTGEAWPDLPFPDLLPMSLGENGESDAGCLPGVVMETALGIDIYASLANYMRSEFGQRGTLFGWDWRKRPQPSFSKLDTIITEALARSGPWKAQKAGRVVLWGHSYGGLFIRAYIEGSGGKRVARVLTAGTPYWGSPKSFFALAFGVESPGFSGMDAVINNARLQGLARNLSGLYNLYPSANYPPWLSVGGALQNQAGVSAFVDAIGGNSALFNQADAEHKSVYDGFYDNGGRIDVRAVVGTGLNTIRSVNVQYDDDGSFDDVIGSFDNGDETVPGRSGAQGPVGGRASMGDPVHVQYTCNVSHVALSGAPEVLVAYEDFLKTGEVPRKLPPACPSAGGGYHFTPGSIGLEEPEERRARLGGEGSLDLAAAEQQGLVDVMELGPAVLAVVNDARPVTLRVPIENGTFTYTPLAGETQGTVATYGPATGTLELSPGAPGGPPVALLDGQPLAPHAGPVDPGPADPGPAAPGPAPAGGTAPPAVSVPAVGRLKIVGRAKLRGRTLKLVLELPGAGALAVRATGKRGRRTRTLATVRKAIRTPGRRTIKLKLKRKSPAKVRVAIGFTPAGGKTQTKRVTVRRA